MIKVPQEERLIWPAWDLAQKEQEDCYFLGWFKKKAVSQQNYDSLLVGC